MVRREFAGLPVVVENPAGSIRQWHDRDGRESGSVEMRHDYGFLEGHTGADGEEVDCYLGPDETAKFAHVVHQLAAPDFKRFDEDKVMLGFADEQSAKAAYLAHRNDGDRAYGGMSTIPLEAFTKKLRRRTGEGKIRHERDQPMPTPSLFRIEHRGSKWVVLPETGDRVLGEHDTEEDAQKQLAAIEASKAKAAEHAAAFEWGPTVLFEVSRGSDQRVRSGVWDFLCVEGADFKDKQWTEFSPETLGEMIRNAATRGDPIPYDWNHQTAYSAMNGKPAPALAYAGAWACVWDGKIVEQGTARGVKVASYEGLDLSRNGLWIYRSEVTDGSADYPLGQQLLPGYKLLSPMFVRNGTDRTGNPVGYSLIAIGCTNSPHQGGTELNLERGGEPRPAAVPPPAISPAPRAPSPSTTENKMNPKMLAAAKFVGLDEKATPAEIRKAFKARAVQGAILMDVGASAMEAGDSDVKPFDYEGMAAKMEDAAKVYEDAHFEPDADDKGDEHVKMRAMAAKFRRMAKMAAPAVKPEGDGEIASMEAAKADEKATKEMATFARSVGIDPGNMSRAQMFDAVRASHVPVARIPELVAETVTKQLAAEREKESAAARKQAGAILMSSVRKDYPGDREALAREAERDPANAAKLAGPWLEKTAPAHLFERMSSQGGAVGGGEGGNARSFDQVPKIQVRKTQAATFIAADAAIADKAKELATSKDPVIMSRLDAMLPTKSDRTNPAMRLLKAQQLAAEMHPDLAAAAEDGELAISMGRGI
jgi:hypothetical protein